jgi:hypothetical protein
LATFLSQQPPTIRLNYLKIITDLHRFMM